ncbi:MULTISPECIES: transcriptional regulator [Pseudonocardia]|jgi:DNA-binding transcriptional ArsR family regulator|uniref:DNA-binding transcriptional ArsR family regulator n=1 Tax=Pseudonocardia alni TaxID=33907 RepID=A0A852W4R1_PSEA5|nr:MULTISPECIES: transcriptional regulator [Pseudonocardia]MYW74629.1 helix-turn-helix domain-containing protein [Pseudonocardia sp. SID8383]NYG03953.1 DNA-binding transcriptional ArsR family regulator [Pseudonocardia antarctica]OJG03461.1 helix-turn-helix protein domain protein [Pseudonocardia autotrophica]PKB30532.1 winged helix DNA-binding protein [Pseudonocardia alni]
MSEDSPDTRLVPLLLDPTRLRVVATLLAAGEVEFAFVRDRVGLSDSALSKQVKALSDAGVVTSRREPHGPARRTWLRLSPDGRRQVEVHVGALRDIAGGADGSGSG